MPLSGDVGTELWKLLEYDGAYDGTPLPDMYEAALQSGVPFARLESFLEATFLTREIPERYDVLSKPFWYRIYTTNIDDLLRRVYQRTPGPKLQVVAFPNDEVKERDQTLEQIQAVFLHGALPARPDEITFSVRQYARRAIEISPLYQQFVGDYATYPTVFIGTELNEPLFWQHIEARERRAADIPEQRPKSFLISPHISPPKRAQLKAYNVVPVEGYASQFLDWLTSVADALPSQEEVLRHTLPSVAALFGAMPSGAGGVAARSLKEFGQAFHLVPAGLEVRGDRSFFLLGATPRWEDIFRELDAPRRTTDKVFDYINGMLNGSGKTRVIALLGSAGSGKSTILRRLGVRLAQSNVAAFLTNSEEFPSAATIAQSLHALHRPAVLLFDNAEIALGAMASIVEATADLKDPVVLVIASRINEFDRRSARLEKVAEIADFEIPNLSRGEIVALLRVLNSQGLLGHLQGLSERERIAEFEQRAGKQLLVAMREATSGEGFNDIIRHEFDTLPSIEAKLLYLVVALATDAGYRITIQQFVRSADVSPAEALHLLDRNLRGIVLRTGARKDLLLLRHRVIAEYILNSVAPRTTLGDAYVRILSTLAGEVVGSRGHSRTFGLYRELVNHQTIYERFSSSLEDARAIYDSIAGRLSSEAHFWLQYGLLELEFGNLQLAENFLRQAESLYPSSYVIQNSIGHLHFRKGIEAAGILEAQAHRKEGSEILEHQMEVDDSPYPFHIYCSQRLAWAHKWIRERDEIRRELEHLRETVGRARGFYARNRKLRGLQEHIEREYLSLAIR
jgi:tetratricopeptide (TPR) repeat protein